MPQDVKQYLRQSLDDRRLSRGERQAMSAVLAELRPAASQLGELRGYAFELARDAMQQSPASAELLDWLEDVIRLLSHVETRPVSHAEACFSPGDACRRRILELFAQTRRSADVCVFTITDNQITSAMIAAHRRGVRLRVITDNDKSLDRGSDVEQLGRAGIPVRIDQTEHHMHHKFAIFDAATVLTGSYNWTVSAVQWNEENLITTPDAGLVTQFSRVFETLWEQFG